MKNTTEIIEDIQEAQIEAGGRFIRQQEIKDMTVDQLLNLLVPNHVEFEIKYKLSVSKLSQQRGIEDL